MPVGLFKWDVGDRLAVQSDVDVGQLAGSFGSAGPKDELVRALRRESHAMLNRAVRAEMGRSVAGSIEDEFSLRFHRGGGNRDAAGLRSEVATQVRQQVRDVTARLLRIRVFFVTATN